MEPRMMLVSKGTRWKWALHLAELPDSQRKKEKTIAFAIHNAFKI